MMPTLAQSAAGIADPMISGKWLLDMIPVAAAAIAVLLGRNYYRNQGAKESQAAEVTIKKPVPTILTRERPVWATQAALDSLAAKHDSNIHNVHRRLDDQVKALARLEGTATATNDTVGKLLDIALGKKPTPRS